MLMFALCDVNSMYASCEKVFDASIRHKPVVVLTNNDGCICSICRIGKGLGLSQKFQPYFKVKAELEALGVVVKSSNYELYGDLSARMMKVCQSFAPDMHVYSIDECFLDFAGFTPELCWQQYGVQIRKTVAKQVCLPIGVGIGQTPTLAKVASHAAKRLEGFNNVAAIVDENMRISVLRQMQVQDVWGVGRKIAARLNLMNIHSAYQLAEADGKMIKRHFGRPLLDTVLELNGQRRIYWQHIRPDKKQIMSTRSFGRRIYQLADLQRELANHVSIVGRKLRQQKSLATTLFIFISNSRHDKQPYKKAHTLIALPAPSADNKVLLAAVMSSAAQIFCSGVAYYRCGVGAVDIVAEEYLQGDMFAPSFDNPQLMNELDNINAKYGADTLFLARQYSVSQPLGQSREQLQGDVIGEKFSMRRQFLSKRYSTRIAEIPAIY